MPEAISLLGYLLAAIMTVVAFVCWRKAMNFHVLLLESSGRIENLKRKGRQLEGELTKLGEKLEQARSNNSRLEKELQAGKQQLKSDFSRLTEENTLLKEKNHQLDLKSDHLRTQVDALTQQLREADNLAKAAQSKVNQISRETQDQIGASRKRLEDDLREWQEKFRDLQGKHRSVQNQLNTLKRKVEEADINRIQDIKRKAVHYESLYKSMRGLREMSDERNKNWETALRMLSAWILRTRNSKTDVNTAALGPMVGEALDIIGERLVHDEFSGRTPVTSPSESQQMPTAT